MEFSGNLFIFFFLLPLLLQVSTCDAYPNPIYYACNKNFISDNLLKDSINKTLSSLLAKTSLDSFGISSSGDGFFAIYGLSQCRGSLAVDLCTLCITKASKEIRTLCPNSSETRIWYDHCFLHYDTSKSHRRMNAMTVGIEEKFSAYGADVSKNLSIVATAQCTRDLEEFACRQCLDKLSENFSSYCKYHLDCYVISSSCVLRYGVSDFLIIHVSLSPVVFAACFD